LAYLSVDGRIRQLDFADRLLETFIVEIHSNLYSTKSELMATARDRKTAAKSKVFTSVKAEPGELR